MLHLRKGQGAIDGPHWQKAKAMLNKNLKEKNQLFATAKHTWFQAPGSGVMQPGVILSKSMTKFEPLIKKFVRALHYRHCGDFREPEDITVQFIDLNAKYSTRQQRHLETLLYVWDDCHPEDIEYPDIFQYRWAVCLDRPEASVWILTFMEKIVFVALVIPVSLEHLLP